MLLTIVAARSMEPEQFGAFSFALIALTMLDGILGSAVDLGVLRQATSGPINVELLPVERAGLAVKLTFGAICLLLALALGDWAGRSFLHVAHGRSVFIPVGIAILAIFAFRSQQVLSQARERFREYGQLEVLHLVFRCGLVLASLYLGYNSPGFVISLFAVAPLMTLLVTRNWRFGIDFTCPRDDLRLLLVFVKDSLAATALGSVASRIDLLCAGWLSAPVVLGRYAAAQSLAQLPEIVATYTAGVMAPWINPKLREGSFRQFFLAVNIGGLVLAAVGAAIGVFASEWVISALLPAKYESTGAILRVLLPGYCASALLFPLTLNFLLFYAPRAFITYDLIVSPIVLLLAYSMGRQYGIAGIAAVATAARLLKTLVLHIYAWRLIGRVST